MQPEEDNTRTHMALTKDTMVGHYQIVEKIGSGGMGEVYLAQDTQLDRKVALKFLPPHLCADEDCRKRFKREAQATAKLDHPNIISVYEVSEYQGRPYFAMAHVEGKSLKEFVAGKDLAVDQILELSIQICSGLHTAHEKGVTHRDVKPSNILIDSHGRARIVDFGLAAVAGSDQLTKTGSTMGTIGYMSPEQVQGKEVDHRSDLFSLGVVLYELITKQNPFRRDSEAATLRAVSDEQPEPLARFKRDIPEGMQAIIDKALEKDVKTRYQHADGLCSDLTRIKRTLESTQTSVTGVPGKKKSSSLWWVSAGIVIIAVALILTRPWVTVTTSHRADKIMLAVLPFENLGDPEDEYFADGVTDEITSRLARVNGLGVIARMSAMQYKETTKPLKQIGKELGVDYLLAGSVRWQKTTGSDTRVRVTPQLIRLSDESHVWTDIYDELLTEVFTVQANMARDVVNALNVTLVDAEKRAISTQPTSNYEAYNLYLRGRSYWERWEHGREDLERSIALLEQATAVDSTFANAYAELAGIHCWYYETGYDRSEERKQLAQQAATLARRYDSLDAYSRIAWGYYYYYVLDDYNSALQELEQARSRLPNSSEALAAMGYVKRRLGQYEESFELQKQAHKLNPLNFWMLYGLIDHCFYMRSFEEAAAYIERAQLMYPDHAKPYCDEAKLYLRRDGDHVKALNALQRAPAAARESMLIQGMIITCAYYARDFDAAMAALPSLYEDLVSGVDTARYYYWAADLNRLTGHEEKARLYLDSARTTVEQLHASGVDLSAEMLTSLGLIYADLGWKDKAIEAAVRHAEEVPISKDALIGMERMIQLAQTYTRVGELDKAVDLIDTLLSIPSDLTVATLRGHPNWDPLHGHPRFDTVLEKYEKIHGT